MFRLALFFKYCLFFVAFALLVLFVLVLDRSPSVQQPSQAIIGDLAETAKLAKRMLTDMQSASKHLTVEANDTQLASAARLLKSHTKGSALELDINTETSNGKIDIYISHRVHEQFWLNTHIEKFDGSGLLPERVRVGRLNVPSIISNRVLRLLLKRYTGNQIDVSDLDNVKSSFSDNGIIIELNKETLAKIQINKLLGDLSDPTSDTLALDKEWLNHYREAFIERRARAGLVNKSASIAYYFRMIDEIKFASTKMSQVDHREYCIVTLSSLLNNPYYNKLLPPLSKNDKPFVMTLGGRQDLAKHFLISASLRILSNRRTSSSIGVAKELIDSETGGSGFSFVDLSADEAGIAFAEHLLQENEIEFVKLKEKDFYPDFSDLDEGLSVEQIREKFESSINYQLTMEYIKSKINRAGMYEQRATNNEK